MPHKSEFHRAFELKEWTYHAENLMYTSLEIKDASECHIQGVLAMNYLIVKNCSFPKAKDEAEEEKIDYYSSLEIPNNSEIKNMIEKAAFGESKYEIELPYTPFKGISPVITSLDFPNLSSTNNSWDAIAIFCSNEKIDFEDPCLKFFQKLRTPQDLEAAYENMRFEAPKIESTNIESLKKFAHDKKSPMIINPEVRVVFFTNSPNQLSSTVRPIAWIKATSFGSFTEIDLLKGNYFTGKFITVKLLTNSSESQPKNIRFYGMSVRGRIIPAEDWLVNAIKPLKKPSELARKSKYYSLFTHRMLRQKLGRYSFTKVLPLGLGIAETGHLYLSKRKKKDKLDYSTSSRLIVNFIFK